MYGDNLDSIRGVVPALQLDLSKVIFDSGNRTFYKHVAVTGVSLDKTDMKLNRGDKGQLKATVLPETTDAITTYKDVTWSSSDTGVATVDENGVVTGVGGGTATITVTATNGTENTADDKTATCTVDVDPKWSNPMTYPATQKVRKTYSESSQTAGLAQAANAQGDVTYTLVSQKSGNVDVSYFTLPMAKR